MNKINFMKIIRSHFGTLCDQRGKLLMGDFIFHIALPVTISLLICYYDGPMSSQMASILVNFGAITTALLMSAIVMVYDQKQKTIDKLEQAKKEINIESDNSDFIIQLETDKTLYSQLCLNISYSILTSALIVILSVAVSFFKIDVVAYSCKAFTLYGLSVICYFLFISTIITFLMIIKRFSVIVEK